MQRQAVGADRLDGDHGGHLIAHRFIGGNGGLANLFPQDANLDTGAYRTLENELADWIEAGAEVRIKVDLGYGAAGNRPDRVRVDYTVHHPITDEEIFTDSGPFNNAPNQTFDRRTREFIENRVREFGL